MVEEISQTLVMILNCADDATEEEAEMGKELRRVDLIMGVVALNCWGWGGLGLLVVAFSQTNSLPHAHGCVGAVSCNHVNLIDSPLDGLEGTLEPFFLAFDLLFGELSTGQMRREDIVRSRLLELALLEGHCHFVLQPH